MRPIHGFGVAYMTTSLFLSIYMCSLWSSCVFENFQGRVPMLMPPPRGGGLQLDFLDSPNHLVACVLPFA